MRVAAILVLAAFAGLAACTTETTPAATTAPAPTNTVARAATSDAGLLSYVNDIRAGQGLPRLSAASTLNAAAMEHARDMVENGYFSHTGSDGSTVGMRARANGCQWTSAAENIAFGQSTPAEAMTTWMNSAGHRANILGSFTRFGEARVGDTWVAVFAAGC